MPRPRTPPQPDRYPACSRCGQAYPTAARWPDGPVCRHCHLTARRTIGRCPSCSHEGVLPGRDRTGQAICRACAGIDLDVQCTRCGREQELYRRGLCRGCYLAEEVTRVFTGPDGTVPERLAPLATALAQVSRPDCTLVWLKQPRVARLLRDLASGRVGLDHAALDALPASRTVEYVRGLLVAQQILPHRDRHLADYQRWLTSQLGRVDDADDRRLLERFGRWHQLRRLREQAQTSPVSTEAFLRAKQQTTLARQFLAWLRTQHVPLQALGQAEVDRWYAAGSTTRTHLDSFLHWALKHRLVAGIQVPARTRTDHTGFGETDRYAAIRRILLDQAAPLQTRVIAGLVLLYGQPVNRLARLTINDLETTPDQVRLRLGRDWVQTPEPFAALMREHAAARPNRTTAANPDSPWLFPGAMPEDHLHPTSIAKLLRRHGVPPRAARTATWRHLVRQIPPAVLAETIGISPLTAARHAALAGADYSRYARSAQTDQRRQANR